MRCPGPALSSRSRAHPGLLQDRILLAGMYLPGSGLTRVLTALARSFGDSQVSVLGFVPRGGAAEAGTIGGRKAMLMPTPERCFRAHEPWLANYLAEQRPRHILVTGPPF